jgi:two-component sensor histidine kinase
MEGDLSGGSGIRRGRRIRSLVGKSNAMLARIGELNDGLKQVSDNIAHDLKTPLTRLRNRAEAALTGNRKPAEYRETLEETISESDQLIKTFNAILMISRLEAGYSAEQLEQVDLSQVVDDVVELYEPVAEEAGVALAAEKSTSRITFNGNRELLAQALSNIVDNAIKYSAGGNEKPAVAVKLEKTGADIRLAVSDNGPGIPEATDRQRATERFVRLEKSRSQPGSGLGLSLAKAIVKYHGGRLDLDSRPRTISDDDIPGREGRIMAAATAKMKSNSWKFSPKRVLRSLDDARAKAELANIADEARDVGLDRLATALGETNGVTQFFGAVFELSDFLRDATRRDPRILDRLFDQTAEERLAEILAAVKALAANPDLSEATLMADLRRLKGEAHVLIALADLADIFDAQTTVRSLSDLADACTSCAIDFLLRDADRQGKLKLPDSDNPAKDSGWIVLGMGKLGARELNFSSDIDLIVFFDPEAPAILDPLDATDLFARLTRRLVRILQDRTEHGYVFRTDLRLRPDPGSTPLAIPVRRRCIITKAADKLGARGDDQSAPCRRRHQGR